jgi:hypothetical protein
MVFRRLGSKFSVRLVSHVFTAVVALTLPASVALMSAVPHVAVASASQTVTTPQVTAMPKVAVIMSTGGQAASDTSTAILSVLGFALAGATVTTAGVAVMTVRRRR